MRSYSKRIVSIFFLLSGVILLAGCSMNEDRKSKQVDTVIVAGSTDAVNQSDAVNQKDDFYFGGKNQAKKTDINLNQIGYRTKDEKIAVVRDCGGANTYQILDEEGNEVFHGELISGYTDYEYKEMLYYADFSKFQKEGTYCLMCGDQVASPLFEISDSVYDEIRQVAIRPFAPAAKFVTNIADEAKGQDEKRKSECEFLVNRCKRSVINGTNEQIDVSGGWCSLSYKGWFTVPSITALANMMYLQTYNTASIEKIPGQAKGSKINLESLIKQEVEWLLKMQDSNSGGVYHKAATKDGSIEKSEDVVYVSSISSCATADFAAIMAKASGLYKSSDKALSRQCLAAARKAWKYLLAHPENEEYTNEKGISSRAYTDHSDADERFFAACELYMVTLEDEFLQAMKEFDIEGAKIEFGWSQVSGYAFFDYYTMAANKEGEVYKRVKEVLGKEVRKTKESKNKGYFINHEYRECSLQELLNRGVLLSLMNQTEKKKDASTTKCVQNYLNYIMGENPQSQNAFQKMWAEKNEQALEVSSALLIVLQGIDE